MTSLAIILAAGFSKRFGADKRIATGILGDKSILLATLEKVIPAFDRVLLVHRFQDQQLLSLVKPYDIDLISAPQSPIGQGESLAAAARYLLTLPEKYITSIAVCLADMPHIETSTYQQLVTQATENTIIRPYYQNQAGQPVIFGRKFLAELATCQGDIGARDIIKKNQSSLQRININDSGILLDIDTEKDLL